MFSLKILRNFHLWAKFSSETFHNLYFSSLYFDIGSAQKHAAVNRYFAWSLYDKGGSVLDVDVLFSFFLVLMVDSYVYSMYSFALVAVIKSTIPDRNNGNFSSQKAAPIGVSQLWKVERETAVRTQ